jgi:hypothetical protein
MPQRATRQSAFDAERGHLKTDMVVLRRPAGMQAVLEPLAEDANTAFARRAADRQRCRKAAASLGQRGEFICNYHRSSHHSLFSLSARPIWIGDPHDGRDRSQLLASCALTAAGCAARSLMIRLHGFRVAANVTDVTRFAETEIRPKPDARFPCRVPVPSAVHLLSEQAK